MPGSDGEVTLLTAQLREGNQEAAIQLAMAVKREWRLAKFWLSQEPAGARFG
jgi:hypothetical protein